MRQSNRRFLPLLSRLRSHHLRAASASARLLSKHRSTHTPRPRNNRIIAGVCAGFALHYGWNLNLVRLLTALVALFTGVGAIAYLIAWVIIPEAPYTLPAKSA